MITARDANINSYINNRFLIQLGDLMKNFFKKIIDKIDKAMEEKSKCSCSCRGKCGEEEEKK